VYKSYNTITHQQSSRSGQQLSENLRLSMKWQEKFKELPRVGRQIWGKFAC
jgi:predicted heme/steroid binding protein